MSVTDGDGPASHDGRAYVLQIYPRLSLETALCCKLQVHKEATAAAVIQDAAASLGLDRAGHYVLAEVKESGGEEWVLEATDLPVHRVLLWPRKAQDEHPQSDGFYFLLQERNRDGSICYVHLQGAAGAEADSQRLVARGFLPPRQEDVADLCNLPTLTEDTILENLRRRFKKKKIYTYAGSILVAINPFKFLPIYNPKYVKMYENHQLGKLEPHIFAIADVSYYAMLRKRINQCIVISGESGSGKTQSTNFLIHCLTALSQKGYASGVERTILGAGPVLEAFGNAKTAHNNNSSRFGKFIQVNYLESGVVRGAVVEKYLLEKSRLVSREKNERNYHVFYYLLVGASEAERKEYKLLQPEDYYYLKQQSFAIEDADDLRHDFERLQQAMEMVGFLPATKRQIFSVLSAILYLGNVTYRRKSTGREEGLDAGPPEVLANLSDLLKVKEELLVEALTKRKTVTVNDKLILPYSHSEAITARDSMAKSLYSALFDWIVLRINHALLNKKDMEESVECLSIGVLDIFGFEDFATNSFEQFCINYANEQLQYYFNQHIFTLEQEEYQMEGITWHNIDYTDNVGCIHLISKKPTGLLYLLDEESNFPHATDKTLLAKFKQQHERNAYFVPTPVMEPAFVILHFAGKVKYQIKDFREKNTDHMRPDIVALLRSSNSAYVRHLIGMDPVAMFRWGILRSALRALAAFNEAGRRRAGGAGPRTSVVPSSDFACVLFILYSRTSMLDFSFDLSEERPLEAFEDIFVSYETTTHLPHKHAVNLSFAAHLPYRKNKGTKTKQLIPKNLLDSRSLKFIVGLHDRTTKSLLHLHKKKKPPSISAQFQTSLSKLLETLGKAEPFFIRCIRSNAEKKEMCFDEALVLQQLCYTGMLETVRIRRSGYGAKYTFQEFIGQFRVLLPRKAPSQEDISTLLQNLGLDSETYQIGKTKVYLKEPERQKLLDALHKDVMRKIIFLQRWFRAKLQRRHFLQLRAATVFVQRSWRVCQQRRCWAASRIQATWRGSRQRAVYRHRRTSVTKIQALVRGQSARRSFQWGVGQQARQKPRQTQVAHSWSKTRTASKLCKTLRIIQRERHRQRRTRWASWHERGLLTVVRLCERPTGFLRKILKKRPHKEAQTPEDGELTMAAALAEKTEVPCPSRPHHLEPPTGRLSRNPTIKISRATRVTEQWNASLDREITNANELRHLDEFLGNQVNDLRSRGKQLSGTENIFITATMQFRENIKSMYSLPVSGGYKGLMRSYQKKVISLAGEKQKGEVQLVVNLFQSVLDGFIRGEIKREEAEPAKVNKRRKKDKNSPLDHMFTHYQVNVMQSCDQCSSYIWGMEKAYMCSCCRMVCHKKCLSKIVTDCSTFCSKKEDSGSQHFGVRVIHLTSDKVPVPVVLEIMLEHVEMNGLYTEGIYRKSGSANRMKELRQLLEADPNKVCLEDYPIHAVTGLVKQWLRELPDPLMTFHLYNDFLHAVELPEKLEQVHAIYRVVEQLPQANFCTLERLIFHLVRVSREEKSNRMTPNSLAIVFAPCILRGPDSDDPLLSMKDVAKTTTCVEMLINEQIKSYNEKMEEIEQLEFAEALAKNQLKLKRNNTVSSQSPAQRLLHTHHCSFQLGSDLLPRSLCFCFCLCLSVPPPPALSLFCSFSPYPSIVLSVCVAAQEFNRLNILSAFCVFALCSTGIYLSDLPLHTKGLRYV
uniref:Myosin IXB n=1 Tax=Electrophorus electricus TaxID=8005 RepID=A0A4W4FGU6_ELEEL